MKRRRAYSLYERALGWIEDQYPDLLEKYRGRGKTYFDELSASDFLRKYAWVVYAAGFKVETLRKHFPAIAEAFHGFELDTVARMQSLDKVLEIFGNERKAKSVRDGARLIRDERYETFKSRVCHEGLDVLSELPGIGAVTKKHLGRNLGIFDVAKDDVWMVRIAELLDADTVEALADELSREFDDGPGVVDMVLWKFCAEAGWEHYGYRSLQDLVGADEAPNTPMVRELDTDLSNASGSDECADTVQTNIEPTESTRTGVLLGILPHARRFELESDGELLAGNISKEVEPDRLLGFNRELVGEPCLASLETAQSTRYGATTLRYTLRALEPAT